MVLSLASLNAASVLLGGIDGGQAATQAASFGGTNPLVALKLAEKNQTKGIADTARQPDVLRDITAFKKAIATAKDAKQLAGNPNFLKVLLTANGLADSVAYPGLAQKLLLSDPADSKSLVNRIADTRWSAVVKTFALGSKGLDIVGNAKVQQTLIDGYTEIAWRNSLDEATPGLSDALTFRQKAATVTSAVQILGDSVLRRVVTKALSIPDQIAFQELPAQERAITSRLDISKLSNKQFVDGLSQQYLLAVQGTASTDVTPSLDALAARSRGLVI
jgi:hypothetical protein